MEGELVIALAVYHGQQIFKKPFRPNSFQHLQELVLEEAAKRPVFENDMNKHASNSKMEAHIAICISQQKILLDNYETFVDCESDVFNFTDPYKREYKFDIDIVVSFMKFFSICYSIFTMLNCDTISVAK